MVLLKSGSWLSFRELGFTFQVLDETCARNDLPDAFVDRVFETARGFDEKRLLRLPRSKVAKYLRRVDPQNSASRVLLFPPAKRSDDDDS